MKISFYSCKIRRQPELAGNDDFGNLTWKSRFNLGTQCTQASGPSRFSSKWEFALLSTNIKVVLQQVLKKLDEFRNEMNMIYSNVE